MNDKTLGAILTTLPYFWCNRLMSRYDFPLRTEKASGKLKAALNGGPGEVHYHPLDLRQQSSRFHTREMFNRMEVQVENNSP